MSEQHLLKPPKTSGSNDMTHVHLLDCPIWDTVNTTGSAEYRITGVLKLEHRSAEVLGITIAHWQIHRSIGGFPCPGSAPISDPMFQM